LKKSSSLKQKKEIEASAIVNLHFAFVFSNMCEETFFFFALSATILSLKESRKAHESETCFANFLKYYCHANADRHTGFYVSGFIMQDIWHWYSLCWDNNYKESLWKGK
jgi:hypothetical protein